eukprot:COSAG02_NODE_54_length_43941_cov_54.857990_6_plen_48_part_00
MWHLGDRNVKGRADGNGELVVSPDSVALITVLDPFQAREQKAQLLLA